MVEAVHDSKHPLDPISRIFDQIEGSANSAETSETELDPNESENHLSNSMSPKPPELTPKDRQSPALLIDSKLRVIWQNQSAVSQLWHDNPASMNGSSTPHIFDLLLSADFKNTVENWHDWISFFMRQAYRMLSREEIVQHINIQDKSEQDLLISMIDQVESEDAASLANLSLNQVLKQNSPVSFQIYACEFNEGCYITFYPFSSGYTSRHVMQFNVIKRKFDQIKLQRDPVQRPFSILAARLNKAAIMQTELLPEEYSRLLNTIMRRFVDTIETYGAIFDQPDGSGLAAYFFPDQDQNNCMSMVECALELKSQMGDISREWKIRKGWLHDIELNIAMHHTDEFIGTLPTALGDRMMIHGNALYVCTQLCRLATDGQIWATKDLVHQMSAEEQKKLRFGIFRKDHHRQVLVSKSFSRLMDLPNIEISQPQNHPTLDSLAVTQVFDRQIG